MKSWSDFYDLILPDVPGCPLAMADLALRQSAISFCEQSLAWKYEHPLISVVSSIAQYAFVLPDGAAVHALTYAALDGKELVSAMPEAEREILRNSSGTPAYVLAGGTFLKLVPKPDGPGALSVSVVLKPSPSAAGIDDSVFDEYRQAVAHGALARLMLSPRKPYTNAQLAPYHAQQFAIQSADAGTRAAKGHTRAPLQTRITRRA
jgi:hypothetical protein